MRWLARAWIAGLMLGLLGLAGAQADTAYPNKPIHIVVGFAAGGGNDILARLVGQKLSEHLGQPVVIDNKPGASSIIAAEFVAHAAPDGYTLLMGPSGAMTVNPAVYAKLPYAPLRDFIPVSQIAEFPLMLVVSPKLPIASIGELVAYAKANPAKANYASSSTAFQLTTELFKQKTGAPLEMVNYKSGNEMILSVVSGEALMTIIDTAPVGPQILSGNVRALAVTASRRMADYPRVPTMAEAGVPGMIVSLWTGFFAPARTPSAIVVTLQDEVMRIVHLPDIAARMQNLAVEPTGTTSAAFAHIVSTDIARWTEVAKASHIKLDP